MIRTATSRVLASLLTGALAFAGLTVSAPAMAAEDPTAITQEVTEAPSEEPTADPTDEGTAAPTDEPTGEPADEPSEAPAEESTAEPTEEPAQPETSDAPTAEPEAAPAATSVVYTGRIERVADHSLDETAAAGSQLFTVDGLGQLRVDTSALDLGKATFGGLTLRLAVPAGLDLPADAADAFAALATASIEVPLVATERVVKLSGRGTSSLINQTPAVSAVHKVYAVLVTPTNIAGSTAAANQTPAKVQTAVTHADGYWDQQSSGLIRFALAGTTTFYKSAYSCATPAGSQQLWTQAAQIASTQLGYQPAPNVHLALFFPSGATTCEGGSIGLGTIGSSVNDGGLLWSIGTDAPIEKQTLAHELGHNLSLGHATWLECATATPNPGFGGTAGCTPRPYGDVVDVMGFGIDGRSGGALSSPNAIRAGIWPSSAYVNAPLGTTSYTLNAVSSNSGLRSVVVEDTNGVNYFVEYRNLTDEDAQYAGYGCNANSCVSPQAEVRIMRLEQQELDSGAGFYYYFKGFPGDDSYLISRTIAGVDRVGFRAGESLTIGAVTVSVTSIDGATATVSVKKNDSAVRQSYVTVNNLDWHSDGEMYVGDRLSAMLEADWTATSYAFQWYRSMGGARVAIAGATKQNYTVTGADLNGYLSVRVTGTGSNGSAAAVDPPVEYLGYGPVFNGSLITGTVTVDPTSYPFRAVTADWTPGVTFAYQWLRDGVAITGATAATYNPVAADRGKQLSVRARASKSGFFTSAWVTSASADYTLYADGVFTISGTPQVGKTVTASTLTYTKNLPIVGTPVAPTVTYQWYRAGVAIAGATSISYTLTSLDYGKAITVTATAAAPGTIKHAINVALAGTILKGDIQGGLDSPIITTSGTTALKLTAALPTGAITEPGVAYAYQWLRAGVAITGATLASYTLTAADYTKAISVRVTVTKSNYTSVVRTSAAKNYSIVASGSPVVGGVLKVGRTLQVAVPSYTIDTGAVSPVLGYQWYRAGVAIPGATTASYTLVSADFGKTLTVNVVAGVSGYQSLVKASAATAVVGSGVIQGSRAVPVVTQSGLTLTSALPAGSLTEAGATVKIQWYRAGVAVTGRTTATYPLTSADFGKVVQVRYTVSKTNYTAYTLASTSVNYSLTPAAAPTISGRSAFGETLHANTPAYTHLGGAVTPTFAYQWLRAGVAIPGAVSADYVLATADLTKAISVRVTPTYPGAVSAASTSKATAAIVRYQFAPIGDGVPEVALTPATMTLTVPDRGVTVPSGAVVAYQWFRGTAAIAGATTASYKLAAADVASAIKVRVTVSKADYLTVALVSVPDTYGLTAGTGLAISDGDDEVLRVGDTLTASFTPGTTDGDGAPATRTVAYQWYRAGVAVAGKTSTSYALTSTDLGKVISVRVTESLAGWLPVATTLPTAAIQAGVFTGTLTAPQVTNTVPTTPVGNTLPTLTAALPVDAIDGTGHTVTWQWYRGAVAVTGATTPTYKVTAADGASAVSVRATIKKAGFTTVTLSSTALSYALTASPAVPVLTGDVAVGQTLVVGPRTFTFQGMDITASFTPKYQWFRSGVAIPGNDFFAYTLTAADAGKAITVRVTAAPIGTIPNVATSTATSAVGSAAFPNNGLAVSLTQAGTTLTVADAGVSPVPSGTAVAYQWYRGSAAIAGATKPAYTLVAADAGQTIRVRVAFSKSGYTTLVKYSVTLSYTITGATPTITGTLAVGNTLAASVAGGFTLQGAPVTPAATSYQWYRAGVAITGATSANYTVTSADLAKALTVKIAASKPGFLSYSKLSAATTAIKAGTFTGTLAGPQIISVAPSKVTAELPAGSIAEPSATVAYQWYRGTTAIVGANKAAYTLVAADAGALLQVRATVSKAGYTSKVLSSVQRTNTIVAGSALVVSGTATVGQSLTVTPPTYTTAGGATIEPDVTYQWYRNGVAVPAATDDYFWVTAADFGKTVSVKVTAQFSGLLPLAQTWATPEPVSIATIAGSYAVPVITGLGTLTATLPVGSITEEDVTYGWAWYRAGVLIPGAVSSSYVVQGADVGALVTARVTVTKPGFAAVVLVSDPVTADLP